MHRRKRKLQRDLEFIGPSKRLSLNRFRLTPQWEPGPTFSGDPQQGELVNRGKPIPIG